MTTPNPETVTVTIPWEAAKAIATAKHSVVLADAAWPIVEACREATTPTPRFVAVDSELAWWVIEDTETNQIDARFRKSRFSEADVQSLCDKLNEGEQ